MLTITCRSGPIIGAGGFDRPGVGSIGQYLDPSEWDGSDDFVPVNSRSILVIAKAAEVLETERLDDLKFEPPCLEPLTI